MRTRNLPLARAGFRRPASIWIGMLAMAAVAGCTRTHYREKADRDVYAIQQERLVDPRWSVPLRPVEPPPLSRFRDPFDPDREPFPPDDPAALRFQISERLHPWRGFSNRIAKRGVRPIEDPAWEADIPRLPDGSVLLNRESAMQMAVVHGREYQTQIEALYLTALDVSLSRFQFQVQPFFNESLFFRHAGGGRNDSNQLVGAGNLGFSKQFYSGAQLLSSFANTLVFEYSGAGFNTSVSSLSVALTQPLLRGAFARIVTQPLSLTERGLLYAIRNFAEFRRALYVRVVAGGGYLGLLSQLQAIRNAEENLRSLQRNLAQTEAEQRAGFKTISERDQFALNVQSQEVALLSQRANLQTSLDAYRVNLLGLPPDLPMTLDESPLDIFELYDPQIQALRDATEALNLRLLQFEETPPREELASAVAELLANQSILEGLLAGALDELISWRTGLGLVDELGETPLGTEDVQVRDTAEASLSDIVASNLARVETRLEENVIQTKALAESIATAGAEGLAAAWVELRELVRVEFGRQVSDVFASQTQVRVYLIDLKEIDLDVERAVAIALANRQDLMNARGQVADAWRNVEVAANALRGNLNLNFNADLGTDPGRDGIFRFDASNSSERIGLRFDAPLVRRGERNAYRAAWISYQRARRAYMLAHDSVVQQIRADMRSLDLARRQFDINREQVVTAVRQVEESEINARTERTANAGLTLLVLQALGNLLGAKNSLIANWVQYETARLALFRDFDIMDIDARGAWTNESIDPNILVTGAPDGPGLPAGEGPVPGDAPEFAAPPAPDLGLPPLP